ncbi:Peptidoglycan-recognition protein LB [Papilio machaon]|uniref:Peptidoglycan-recognition protein LB n=1 Tax=Papilio machaon TaxID=76193 RepID=A0A0N1PHM4_PAPMA|nr:Peptidoglycan-recognition protein LB [Papilio machaon]
MWLLYHVPYTNNGVEYLRQSRLTCLGGGCVVTPRLRPLHFAVGGDGSIYEGRGWKAVGAHASGYNSVSIGIVLIGDFVSQLPLAHQLELTKELITVGVELGYISKDYSLIGHRQVRSTECPGDALFQEITTWDRFDPTVNTN